MEIGAIGSLSPFTSAAEGVKENPIEKGFESVFDSVQSMNDQQMNARQMMTAVLTGESENAHGAMLALEKASMQMQLATTVRDKLIQGYNQIINMQI